MKLFLLSLLLVLSLSFAPLPGAAAAAPPLIIILLPGTSLEDWQTANAPNLHRLMQTGALAVMNTRSAHHAGEQGRETPQSVLLTLGAGARADGTQEVFDFLPPPSPAPSLTISSGALFERRTGRHLTTHGLVCLSWPAVMEANHDSGYDLRLGNLTDTLAAHGVATAAGGGPNAAWIAAQSDGTARYDAILHAAPDQCVIWDAGSSPAGADALIADAAAQTTRRQGRVIILSPYPSAADYARGYRLTPLLVWGSGIRVGLLASSSTRRPGLVTDTDFAPSVARYYGIERSTFKSLPFGFAWSVVPSAQPVRETEQISRQAIRQAEGMRLLPYLAAASGLWLIALTLLPKTARWTRALTLVPVTAFMAALFAASASSYLVLLVALLALMLALVIFVGPEISLTIAASLTVLALVLDMLIEDPLMHRGLLGYSAIEGARYYGIGNEAMGLLLGTALLAVSRLWTKGKSRQIVLSISLAAITVLVGSAGAKAGGVVVSLAVSGAFLFTALGRRWTKCSAAALAVIVIGGLAAAAFGDALLHPSGHSHLGEAVQRIASSGLGEAADIVRRKLAVEGRLAVHSAWAFLLWTGVLCVGQLWKRMPATTSTEAALRLAGIVGVMNCLLFNDAGVVAAAIFVVYLWSAAAQRQNLPASETSEAGRLGL